MKENKASITAYTVLQGLMYVAMKTPHSDLVPQSMAQYGQKILSFSDEGRKRLAQINSPGFSVGVKIREFLFLPGITLHYVLRKRCIEERTREALRDGARQIISLGAGFDSLALRLAEEFPDVNFIEIDHPSTQQFKAEALKDAARDNLHYLSIDFTHQNLEGRLGAFDAFQPSLPTLYICEGVTMYLSEEEVIHMFDSIRHLSGAGTKFLFTALEPQNSPRNNTRKLLDMYLNLIGEPIRWSIEAPDMEMFLKNRNCTLLKLDDTQSFKSLFLKPEEKAKLHEGEYLIYTSFKE